MLNVQLGLLLTDIYFKIVTYLHRIEPHEERAILNNTYLFYEPNITKDYLKIAFK